jgi:energy-coupling factor transport system permease protein
MQSSTLFIEKKSAFHSLHPLTKLSVAGLFFVASFALPSLRFLLLSFAFLLLPFSIWANILAPFLRNSLLIGWPFVLSLSIIQGFFTYGETILFTLGRFTFTEEGLLSGLTVAARIMLALGGALLLMLSTRPDKLMLALRERGLPDWLGYIVLTALQIFPRFQVRASVIMDAQKSRGLEFEASLVRRLRLLVPLISPLILSSIVDVEERAMALEARAFNYPAKKTSLIKLEDSVIQGLIRSLLLLLMLVLILFRLKAFFSL